MKTLRFFTFWFTLLWVTLACEERNDDLPTKPQLPANPSVITFDRESLTLREDQAAGQVTLPLSAPAPTAGTVVVRIISSSAVYGRDFTTEPAAIGGEITWAVEPLNPSLSLIVRPVANEEVNTPWVIQFTIDRASGGVRPGELRTLTVTLQDNTPVTGTRLAKYETFANQWRVSRNYTYLENGLLHQINWTQETPDRTNGFYTYHYENGKLARMTDQFDQTTFYRWGEGNRIIKSEKFRAGQLVQFIEYYYDDASRVSEMMYYERLPGGGIDVTFLHAFYYQADGNIRKREIYGWDSQREDFILLTTHVFENYMDKPNPVSMVETLPHLNPQPNLPRIYRIITGSQQLTYEIQYQLRADGLPTQRTILTGTVPEVTNYTYF
ncbi:MAG: hypothetical protein JNK44_04785 [Cyclobacteriaceae bacterium]|nr:hypothetical protein [Cyclobacteriaceae bacterium]